MQVVIIHGQAHKGSTYHVARLLAEHISGEISEFFLPRDFSDFCSGCTRCFMEDEEKCPHHEHLQPLTDALDAADVIILASPVYVYHVTGAMKSLLDHLGYRWMVHRPRGEMFSKQGVAVCTAAGAGVRSTLKDLTDSLVFWGVGRTYRMGYAVHATRWEGVSDRQRARIERDVERLAKTITRRSGHVRPAPKTKALFFAMRLAQRTYPNPPDAAWWAEHGWSGRVRPWRKTTELSGTQTHASRNMAGS